MSELSIIFTTGNLIADTGVFVFAVWVYVHSKEKEKCYAERERIRYETYEKHQWLQKWCEEEEKSHNKLISNLVQLKGRISSDEWDKEWDKLCERYNDIKKARSDEEHKIIWEEGNCMSDFQGKYFPVFKRHRIYFKVIIAIFSIGLITQFFALSGAYDFIYATLSGFKNFIETEVILPTMSKLLF